jgi:hypothetical protein
MRPSDLAVVLVYEPDTPRSHPVAIARVGDARLVAKVAAAAVTEAEQQAKLLSATDAGLGRIQSAEARRLGELLGVRLRRGRGKTRN